MIIEEIIEEEIIEEEIMIEEEILEKDLEVVNEIEIIKKMILQMNRKKLN